jgi:hypothetical protein
MLHRAHPSEGKHAMHKTMLAALIVATSALSIPAFAQVHVGGVVGGAGHVGAGVNAGTAMPSAMHTADQTIDQANQTMRRADRQTKHMTHKAVDQTRSAITDNGSANAGMNASGSAGASTGDTHAGANVDTGAGIDTANTAGKAGEAGQGVGGAVRDTAHSAIQATDRTAGSVGTAVKQTATEQSVGADAKVDAKTKASAQMPATPSTSEH